MFKHCDTDDSPWYVVPADSKKKARLYCISLLLSQISCEDLPAGNIVLPPRTEGTYDRPSGIRDVCRTGTDPLDFARGSIRLRSGINTTSLGDQYDFARGSMGEGS